MASLSLGLRPAAILTGGETLFTNRPPPPGLPPFAAPLRHNSKDLVVLCAGASKPVVAAENAKATRRPTGITKPRLVSPAMQELVGVSEIPRTQVLKLIWAYIKENNLQDPENKKIIVCDEKLKNIFGGRDRVGFLEVSGLINPHFIK